MKLSKIRFHLCGHTQKNKRGGVVLHACINGMKSSTEFFFIDSWHDFGTKCQIINARISFITENSAHFSLFQWFFSPGGTTRDTSSWRPGKGTEPSSFCLQTWQERWNTKYTSVCATEWKAVSPSRGKERTQEGFLNYNRPKSLKTGRT